MTATSFEDLAPFLSSRVFRPTFLRLVEADGHRRYLDAIGLTRLVSATMTIRELFEEVYAVMHRRYRTEYLYKNEVIRRLVISRHNPDATTVLLEKPISNWASRLDMLVVNKTTTAYEVKTDYDDLSRLRNQTNFALLAFDRVYIACSERWVDAALSTVDARVGVVAMRATGTFAKVRRAQDNACRVDPRAVFALLRRSEYIAAIEKHVGALPPMNDVTRYDICHELFCQIPASVAHQILLEALKMRFVTGRDKDILQGLPRSLTHLYYQATARERGQLFSPAVLGRTIG